MSPLFGRFQFGSPPIDGVNCLDLINECVDLWWRRSLQTCCYSNLIIWMKKRRFVCDFHRDRLKKKRNVLLKSSQRIAEIWTDCGELFYFTVNASGPQYCFFFFFCHHNKISSVYKSCSNQLTPRSNISEAWCWNAAVALGFHILQNVIRQTLFQIWKTFAEGHDFSLVPSWKTPLNWISANPLQHVSLIWSSGIRTSFMTSILLAVSRQDDRPAEARSPYSYGKRILGSSSMSHERWTISNANGVELYSTSGERNLSYLAGYFCRILEYKFENSH